MSKKYGNVQYIWKYLPFILLIPIIVVVGIWLGLMVATVTAFVLTTLMTTGTQIGKLENGSEKRVGTRLYGFAFFITAFFGAQFIAQGWKGYPAWAILPKDFLEPAYAIWSIALSVCSVFVGYLLDYLPAEKAALTRINKDG